MKKTLTIFLLLTLVVVFTVPAYAEGWDRSSWDKLKGGMKTIGKSPLQLSKAVAEEYDSAEFKPFGVLGGLFKGLFYWGKEFGTGLVDVLTCTVDY